MTTAPASGAPVSRELASCELVAFVASTDLDRSLTEFPAVPGQMARN